MGQKFYKALILLIVSHYSFKALCHDSHDNSKYEDSCAPENAYCSYYSDILEKISHNENAQERNKLLKYLDWELENSHLSANATEIESSILERKFVSLAQDNHVSLEVKVWMEYFLVKYFLQLERVESLFSSLHAINNEDLKLEIIHFVINSATKTQDISPTVWSKLYDFTQKEANPLIIFYIRYAMTLENNTHKSSAIKNTLSFDKKTIAEQELLNLIQKYYSEKNFQENKSKSKLLADIILRISIDLERFKRTYSSGNLPDKMYNGLQKWIEGESDDSIRQSLRLAKLILDSKTITSNEHSGNQKVPLDRREILNFVKELKSVSLEDQVRSFITYFSKTRDSHLLSIFESVREELDAFLAEFFKEDRLSYYVFLKHLDYPQFIAEVKKNIFKDLEQIPDPANRELFLKKLYAHSEIGRYLPGHFGDDLFAAKLNSWPSATERGLIKALLLSGLSDYLQDQIVNDSDKKIRALLAARLRELVLKRVEQGSYAKPFSIEQHWLTTESDPEIKTHLSLTTCILNFYSKNAEHSTCFAQLNNKEKKIVLYAAFFEIKNSQTNQDFWKSFDDFLSKINTSHLDEDPVLEFAVDLLRLQRNLTDSVEPFLSFLESQEFKQNKTKYTWLLKEKLIDTLLSNKNLYSKNENQEAINTFTKKWYLLETDEIIRTRILKFVMEKMENYKYAFEFLSQIENKVKEQKSSSKSENIELAEENARSLVDLLQYFPLFPKEDQNEFKTKALPLAGIISLTLSQNLTGQEDNSTVEKAELINELSRFLSTDNSDMKTSQTQVLTQVDEKRGIYLMTVDTQKYDIGLAVANDWNSPKTPSEFSKQMGGIGVLSGGSWEETPKSELKTNEFKFLDSSLLPDDQGPEPSALIKSKGVLWHDASGPWGVAAWKRGKAGEAIFGEVMTEWISRDFYAKDYFLKRGLYHPSFERTHVFLPADAESFSKKLNNLHLVIEHNIIVNFEFVQEKAVIIHKRENAFAFDFAKNQTYRPFNPRKGIEMKVICNLKQVPVTNLKNRYVEESNTSPKAELEAPISYASQTWQDKDFIISGRPILIENNRIRNDIKQQDPSDDSLARNNRTSFCVHKDGTWNLLVSTKFNIYELANYLKDLGCKNALMLDGGASSTLGWRNEILTQKIHGNFLDSLTEGLSTTERPVSNVLLVIKKNLNLSLRRP